jgi:hypothetical protein
MAIRVRGTMTIERKNSRRGDFNIGDLCTEIGVFEVKDSLIEEFEPGEYTGDFIIQWIEPDSFAWRGKVFVKNRATLAEILIDHAEEGGTPPAPPPEPDPIDNSGAAPASAPPAPSLPEHPGAVPGRHAQPGTEAPVGQPAQASADPTSKASPDQELFGDELFEQLRILSMIKLDPSVDRQKFRAQRDRLKELGYSFDAKAQTWAVLEEA